MDEKESERLAKLAYNEYSAHTGWQNYGGEQPATWEQLPEIVRIAWCITVIATVNGYFDGY